MLARTQSESCLKHGISAERWDFAKETYICMLCMEAFSESRLATDASRQGEYIPSPLMEVDEASTEDVLQISAFWPNGKLRDIEFCKRRTCLYVKLTRDKTRKILVCTSCDYFEVLGTTSSKEARAIYARDMAPLSKTCSHCKTFMILDKAREIFFCWRCSYFEVAEFLQFTRVWGKVKRLIERRAKNPEIVGQGSKAVRQM